jgi:hypothetical protein
MLAVIVLKPNARGTPRKNHLALRRENHNLFGAISASKNTMIYCTVLSTIVDLARRNIAKDALKDITMNLLVVLKRIIGYVFSVEIYVFARFVEEKEEKMFLEKCLREKKDPLKNLYLLLLLLL